MFQIAKLNELSGLVTCKYMRSFQEVNSKGLLNRELHKKQFALIPRFVDVRNEIVPFDSVVQQLIQ